MRATRFRDPKLLRPFSVVIAEVSEKKLRVVAISEARAAQAAKKIWRRESGPRVRSVRLDEAA